VFFSVYPGESMEYCGRCVVAAGLQSESILVQQTYNGSGNGAFLAVVAVPRINNLRVINTLNSSTPAASNIFCQSACKMVCCRIDNAGVLR